MKQGKIYNKLIFGLLLLAVLAYVGYAAISALRSPMTTVLAVQYEAGQGLRTTGYVVRQEQTLTSTYPITTPLLGEGQKVGVGEAVATGYASDGAQAQQQEIAALQQQLGQLQYADDYSVSGASDAAELDGRISKTLVSYAQSLARRDLASANELSLPLKGLVLRRSADEGQVASINLQISQIQAELTRRRGSAGTGTGAISVDQSGYFSGTVDGLETVLTPERLGAISVRELAQLKPATSQSGAFGRLVTDATWYYLTAVPAEQLNRSSPGDLVEISFSHDFYSTLTMEIARIGDEEGGQRILVLKTYNYIQDVTLLREQTANIVFHTYRGLRVPKDALRMDEAGNSGVYVLESANARWKPVRIVFDNGESYVVALDQTSPDNLWPGDEIIVDAKNLYDGKVVA